MLHSSIIKPFLLKNILFCITNSIDGAMILSNNESLRVQGKLMKTRIFPVSKLRFHSLALPLSIAVFSSFLTPVQAQPETSSRSQFRATGISPIVSFEPPDDKTSVDDSRGGASRQPNAVKCSQDQAVRPSMTPLTPGSKGGLTVATHPTFFVYIPPTSAPQAHFTLRDENNRGVYQILLPVANTGGIVSINLPEDKPPLELGKTYRWSMALICQPTQTDIPIVGGQVRRVELKSSQVSPRYTNSTMPDQKALLEQAALYAKVGIWYDSLSLLAQLKQTQPSDNTFAANWVELLDSVGLEEIATQPLLK